MPRIRVLFVDDSPIQIESFRKAVVGSDYDVVTAVNIAEALSAAQNGGFDFAIVDYMIGDERGDDCVRELRTCSRTHTRYFLYTTDADAFRRYRELGFDGVLMLKGKSSLRSQIDTIARSIARMRSAG